MKISDEIPFFHVKFPHKMKLKIKTFLVKWVPFWRHFNLKKTFLFEFFCSFRVKQRVVSMYLTVFWETRRLNLRSKWVNKKLVKFYKGKFFIMKKMRIWFFNFVWVFSRNLAQMRLKCQCFFLGHWDGKSFSDPSRPREKFCLRPKPTQGLFPPCPCRPTKTLGAGPWVGFLGSWVGTPSDPKAALKKILNVGGSRVSWHLSRQAFFQQKPLVRHSQRRMYSFLKCFCFHLSFGEV